MSTTRVQSRRALGLLGTAVAGGAVALGGAAAFGDLGNHTTVQQIVQRPASSTALRTQRGTRDASGSLTDEQIYQRDAPAVVQITATTVRTTPNFFGSPQTSTEQALGSGFVIDKAGHIVTNEHVVAGANKVQVSFSGQDELRATVVGTDASTDIAVLKVDTHARALTPLPYGDSDAVNVGDHVVAIGNPFGLTRTLTSGVVSAVQRQIIAPNSLPIDNAIQTDAAINHGNSGGPLIDSDGKVIGVTSQIQTGSTGEQGNVGIGFAIPINLVRTVAAQIVKNGHAQHALLGVTSLPITPTLARIFNLPVKHGLLVQRITPGSGAARAHIKAGSTSVVVQGESYLLGGDVITKVDGNAVQTTTQLYDAISKHQPGDKVKLEIYRQGKQQTVTAKLGARTS